MKRIIDKQKGMKDGINAVLSEATIKQVMAELGKRGGLKSTVAKKKSSAANAAKARAAKAAKAAETKKRTRKQRER